MPLHAEERELFLIQIGEDFLSDAAILIRSLDLSLSDAAGMLLQGQAEALAERILEKLSEACGKEAAAEFLPLKESARLLAPSALKSLGATRMAAIFRLCQLSSPQAVADRLEKARALRR